MAAKRYLFSENEIPYGKLRSLGINKQQMLSMPGEVIKPLMRGELTPLIQARIKSRTGKVYTIPMKLHLTRDRYGRAILTSYPVRRSMIADVNLSPNESQRLRQGETIRKEVKEDGKRVVKFISMDAQTKSLVKRDAVSLRLNDQMAEVEKVKDIELGQNQKDAIREGKPVELDVGNEKVTVGVEPSEPQGFKVINGDMNEWDRQQKIKYDLENEGFMGYVMTDENRWEYQQVVNHLERKENKLEKTQEQKVSTGLKL